MKAASVRRTLQPLVTIVVTVAWLMCGSQPTRAESMSSTESSTRNNCYSLLHQLLDEQKDVSLLRFIKREHEDVKNLVKKIAKTSGAGAKLLEEMAKQDPSINLREIRLPQGEIATRAAIAATKKKALLGEKGAPFELSLLLAQAEALSYAWHLAKVAAENEPQPDRARLLAGLSQDMEHLYHQVFALLLAKRK